MVSSGIKLLGISKTTKYSATVQQRYRSIKPILMNEGDGGTGENVYGYIAYTTYVLQYYS